MVPSIAVILCFAALLFSPASATFSIVAVDTATGEVGSVGASCIDTTMNGLRNLRIDRISEIVPGRGAINGQQNWAQAELAVAKERMMAGDSPSEILDVLMESQYRPQRYQYVIADISPDNRPRVTAFTGTNGTEFKGHQTGGDYALAGNLLMGEHVLDSMRNAFERSGGLPLPDRLMAGIQGANFPGADGRCLDEGVSSLSAYIRVAKPNNSNYLHIAFGWVPPGTEPLDELQEQFDEWKETVGLQTPTPQKPKGRITMQGGTLTLSLPGHMPDRIWITDLTGKTVHAQWHFRGKTAQILLKESNRGLYLIQWFRDGRPRGNKRVVVVR